MSTYQINGLLKFAEEDKWKEGCIPGTEISFDVTGNWTGETQEEVIKNVADYLSVEKDGIERDACEEPGRVDFAVMEDNESTPLSKAQIERWKKGEIKAWYAVYSGIVERVEPVALTTPEPAGNLAPRLLQALKGLVNCPDYRGIKTHEMNAARAAIAAAEAGTETPTCEINPLHEAAPDLLDALKSFTEDKANNYNSEFKHWEAIETLKIAARTAIAKAGGYKK